MTRRSRWLFALLAALLAFAGAVHWASRPQRLTGAVLDGIGAALGLELTASGVGEYRLRGEPRLVVRDLVARQPGARDPVLRAGRLDIALPWSTVRARGDVLDASRLELDDAVLDLRALRRWQATRPPADAPRIPTLTRGLRVQRGTVIDDRWRIERLSIETPRVDPQRRFDARLGGLLRTGDVRTAFELALALSRPSLDAQATLRGRVQATAPSWRLPATVDARGRMRLDAAPMRIEGFRLGAVARFAGEGQPVPFTAGIAGLLHLDGGVRVRRAGLVLRGDGAVPTLAAAGPIAWREGLTLDLAGSLAQWPDAWPALPAPLGRLRAAIPFVLAYSGPTDLSSVMTLEARHADTAVDVAFELPELLAWNADHRGSPLPPITGRASTDRVEIAGATLEGVEFVIEDDAASAVARDDAAHASDEPAAGGARRAPIASPDPRGAPDVR